MIRQTKLYPLTVDTIAVKLKPCVVQDEVDSASGLLPEVFHLLPEFVEVITQDVLLSGREMVASSGLKRLDLLFRHVDQKRQICRISPEAHCRQGQSKQ